MKNSLQPLSSLKLEFLFFAKTLDIVPTISPPRMNLENHKLMQAIYLTLVTGSMERLMMCFCCWLFGLVEVVLFRLVDLYIVGWSVSVLRLLFCWFAWWCLVYIVLIGLVLGGTWRCHKGDSLYEPDTEGRPWKIWSQLRWKLNLAQSPCGIIQKVRKSRMSKSQTAPYFNSTGNALNPLIEWIEMMEVWSGKSRFSPW